MPPTYEKELLERLAQQTEENNKILRSLRRHARWGAFFGSLKWAIIIVPIILAYQYFQPYFGSLKDDAITFREELLTFQDFGSKLKMFNDDEEPTANDEVKIPPCIVE